MGVWSLLVGFISLVLLYMGNKFLKDVRAIRKELADGATLKELDAMVNETRDSLLADYDEVTSGLDKRVARLEKLNRNAEANIARLEKALNSERLKVLEERGILFAIEAGEKSGPKESDRSKRVAELLKGGASVEEVARMTEASVREVELIRLLLKRADRAEGA